MKNFYKRIITFLLLALTVVTFFPEEVYAGQISDTYTYNSKDEAVPSQNIYQVKQFLINFGEEYGHLNQPQDIFVDNNDHIYILDSGNRRVLILDDTYKVIKEITEFTDNGETITLGKGASGIFFREDNQALYIADTKNDRILVSDLDGEVIRIYEKPVSVLLDPNMAYAPVKVVVDDMGFMYVISQRVNTGAIMVDEDNNFWGFYGTNEIKQTAEVILEYTWRKFLTEKQKEDLVVSFQPVQFNNLFWSDDSFMYVVSPENEQLKASVSKLNTIGKTIFPEEAVFGVRTKSLEEEAVNFIDITVDDDNFFTIIDQKSGKLYHYDEECNLIAAFGGLGYQKGRFTMPVALETNSKKDLLILDSAKATVTIMEKTDYGRLIAEALVLHNQGLYVEAIEKWEEVILMNANYIQAYGGMGKAFMQLEKYEQALEYFEIAGDQENYSKAKTKIREVWIRDNFVFIGAFVVAVVAGILFFDTLKKYITSLYRFCTDRKVGMRK